MPRAVLETFATITVDGHKLRVELNISNDHYDWPFNLEKIKTWATLIVGGQSTSGMKKT